jgi:outer membrane protein assembly factor BamA
VNALSGTNSALHVAGLDSEDIIHPRRRFYSGGSRSVRGYGENQLGPRVLTVSPIALTRVDTLEDGTVRDPICTEAQLRDSSCDPNSSRLDADNFNPQPLGGTSLAEGSIELRFPLVSKFALDGAVFVDGAVIGTDRFSSLLGASGSVTPGFGVRLQTPVGPVRLDLGIRPTLVETLPVITQVTDPDSTARLVTLATPRRYDPVDTSGNFFQKILARLMLHLAIGPAF